MTAVIFKAHIILNTKRKRRRSGIYYIVNSILHSGEPILMQKQIAGSWYRDINVSPVVFYVLDGYRTI